MSFRIGTVPYLVAKPLSWGLEDHPQVHLVEAPPADLAAGLKSGELDVALASSILALEDPELHLWQEGPVIAGRGPIRSVLLLLRPGLQDPSEIRSWTPDPHSRTGQGMARILLHHHLGIRPQEVPEKPGENPFDSGVDAVQRIGDPALEAVRNRPNWKILDLGETWRDRNRLPFVYAGWIGRKGFEPSACASILRAAAREGLANRDRLVDLGRKERGYSRSFLQRYLFEDLCYQLPAREVRAALQRFRELLTAIGQIPASQTPGSV
ncbi:MAG: hypothetical protein DWQ01_04010 [Planctomycetota bacterium]|nr:MAG: hypothetical protein DWQ01_04010 [Planctomycetota bacterium]